VQQTKQESRRTFLRRASPATSDYPRTTPTTRSSLFARLSSSSTSSNRPALAEQPSPPGIDQYRRCRPRPVREKRREESESSGRRRIRFSPRLDGAFQFVTLIQRTPGSHSQARQHPSLPAQAFLSFAHRALGSPSTIAVGHWWIQKDTPSHQREEVLQDTMKVRHSSDAAATWQHHFASASASLCIALSAQV